jgi:hypothetical protein
MSPLASSTILPLAQDHAIHVGYIVQARQALEEGQFPIRVAPWEHDGLRYAAFQFYSPLPSTVGAVIYKYFTPHNPYAAYRTVLWLSLVLAGFFIYRLTRYLFRSPGAALIAGTAYMAAPYMLININSRGTMTEVAAQAIVPAVVYYTIRSYASPRLAFVVVAALAWLALSLTHTLTWVYLTLLLGLFLLTFSFWARRPFVSLGRAAGGYVLALLLGAYFVGTLGSTGTFGVQNFLNDPGEYTWLTPLISLLSPVSVPSEPLGVHGRPTAMNPAVGLPILVAAGVVSYALVARRGRIRLTGASLAPALLLVFVVALFFTWSPVGVWTRLPSNGVLQFTYRLLAQTSWAGAVLVALAVRILLPRRVQPQHIVVAIMVIALAAGSYLPEVASSKTTPTQIAAAPSFGYGSNAYMVRPVSIAPSLRPDVVLEKSQCVQHGATRRCTFDVPLPGGAVQLPQLYYDGMLDVREKGRKLPYYGTTRTDIVLATVYLAPGHYEVVSRFSGFGWANAVSRITWAVLLLGLAAVWLRKAWREVKRRGLLTTSVQT